MTSMADPEQLRQARGVMLATVTARLAIASGMDAGEAVDLLQNAGVLLEANNDPMVTALVVTELAGLVVSLLQVLANHGDQSLEECWRIVCRNYAQEDAAGASGASPGP